ncbi:hypothetical protein [Streptomyces sp. SID13031]|uniref:hypothetical protein n=1 Tax=Streptomyces sp. SID13031 TaxID=2706046 RepID=UPI0013CB253D|nr:hypothetical protein [Streptomyces sp. SID13031]NEA32017.1 hypothetical protein [Streptomyces sp. SID13031]
MTDADRTKPLVLGYIRQHLLMTEDELVGVKARLVDYAFAEGFTMGTVFIEQRESTPAAFEALVQAISQDQASAVVLPSMLHFAVLGAPLAVKLTFERATGAQVFVAAGLDWSH